MSNAVLPASPKPSRAPTPYICYVKENMNQRPTDIKATKFVSKIASQWRLLTPEERQPYLEMGEAAKNLRIKKMKEYTAKYTNEQIRLAEELHKKRKRRGVGKKPRDPSLPKRALTPFTLFFKEYSEQSKAKSKVDESNALRGSAIMKAAGSLWREMPPTDKEKWNAMAAKLKSQSENTDASNNNKASDILAVSEQVAEDGAEDEEDYEEDEYEEDE